jgi:hypothetical protein
MHQRLFFWDDDVSLFIELHGHLLVNDQYIMHFRFEVRITLFTVILDLKGLYIRPFKNLLHHWLCDGHQSGIFCFLGMLLDVFMKVLQCPEFLCIAKICRPLTGNINFTNDSRFQGGKEYTRRIIYLERGGCDSNCSIRFNIPLTKRPIEFEKQDEEDSMRIHVGDKVSALIWQKTDLGFKAIIDNKYGALLYDSQVFKDIHTGDKVEAYITKIRPDGTIDIALQKSGRQHTEDFAEQLLRYLQYRGGRCRLGDKSGAEEIKEQFGVSKKTYKRAIGDLYKRRLITITEDGIELV